MVREAGAGPRHSVRSGPRCGGGGHQGSPKAFAKVYGDYRQCLTRHFPYSVYYRIADDAIVIIAVHHQRRDPAHWQRVLRIPIPGHRDFDEVNLRFYVRRQGEDGAWRRAVVFVREFVPRRAIATVARWFYDEPYTAVRMRHEVEMGGAANGESGRAAYSWRLDGRWHHLEVRTSGLPTIPDPASEAAFISEHYWGYTVQRDGGCKEYRVTHPPWRVWNAVGAKFDCDVMSVYGAGFAECLSMAPRSAFLAEGSTVAVYPGRRLAVAAV